MAFNPTFEQELAINTDGNILVSAAAGSGKTAVLVERVIRKLTDSKNPISADRLLIVTFTNAAAAEMRSRIEKRLNDEIKNHPDDIALLKQKHLLASADVCTIDSFCIKLVRENFEKCGIEPDFKISDGSQLTAISRAVMASVLERQMLNPTQEFQKLLELTGCEYDESNLASTIERIYLYSVQMPFQQAFLHNLIKPYRDEFKAGHFWYDQAFALAQQSLFGALKPIEKMVEAAINVEKNRDKHIAYAETAARLINTLYESAKKADWNEFFELIHSSSLQNAPAASKDDRYAEVFKENKKEVADTIKQLQELFFATQEDICVNIKGYLPAVKLLIDLVEEYSTELFEACKAENTFTFSNTEQLALSLLCKYEDGCVLMSDDGKFLADRYDEVLVDEFQDVNDLQNMLFYVLSNCEEKLFVVGDVKQSIYGFRGSNPDNFLNKKNTYKDILAADSGDAKKIILSDNFRSRKGICDIVNFFFLFLLAGQRSGIIYDESESLRASAKFPAIKSPTCELFVIDNAFAENENSLLENESRVIAQYIQELMSGEDIVTDNGQLRQARYCDFAILLDTMKDKASVIAETLSRSGIPVGFTSQGFLETVEIATVLALLQTIDNPQNDVQLLCVMMSQIFGFTAEEMANIRCVKKDGNLYSAVIAAANSGDEKVISFLNVLSQLRREAAVLPLDRLILYILQSTDISNIMHSMSGGKARLDNLHKLVELAAGYSQGGKGSIYGFIRYINSLPQNSFSLSSSGEECVKIMSMHNSKGLQFPICIVANLASQINNSDSIGRVLFSEKLGIAFKYFDEQALSDVRILGHRLISKEASAKTLEERMRLLYVALTRAQDKLCIFCSCKDAEKKLKKIDSALDIQFPYIRVEFLDSAHTMADWVLAAALMHPDCELLRNVAESDIGCHNTESELKLHYITDIPQLDEKSNAETRKERTADLILSEKIKENIEFVYPKEALRFIEAKTSVSRLANSAENERFAFSEKPAFMLKSGISAASRGTAMHAVMQFIKMDSCVDVRAEIERLCEWQFITEQQAAALDINALERFFESDIYNRALKSLQLHRELRFMTEIPASRVDDTLEGELRDEKIIVQGSVDLCFVESDGVVVLDFKTDRVQDLRELSATYGEQLDIYAKACEKIFGKRVKEKIIYSFHLNDSISF